MLRCFIALELSLSVREQIAALQQRLQRFGQRVSWVRPANIHLTLKFLGDVREEQVNPIADALALISSHVKPFEFAVQNIGFFPDFRKPRILWVGVVDADGQVSNLFHKINDELIHFGFSRENRKFKPHLTMGRVKSKLSTEFIAEIEELDFTGGRVEVINFIFMKSDLKPGGAIYTPLRKMHL